MNVTDDSDDDLQALAGEYVLGTLDSVQRREVEARLEHDPELGVAVRAWEDRLDKLNSIPQEQALPPHFWARILQHNPGSPSTFAAQSAI